MITATPTAIPSPPSGNTGPGPTSPYGSGRNLSIPANAKHYEYFKSPSGNICCDVYADDGDDSLSCAIKDYTYKDPPEPAGNQTSWGGGMVIYGGAPGTLNRGGVLMCEYEAKVPVLKYGETTRRGQLACRSEQSGMVCWDRTTGRGFTLAREAYSTF